MATFRPQDRYAVQCGVVAFKGRMWARLSTHVYNDRGDFEALAVAVKTLVLQGGWASLDPDAEPRDTDDAGPATCIVYRSNGPVKMYVYVEKDEPTAAGPADELARLRARSRARREAAAHKKAGADDGIDPTDRVATALASLPAPPSGLQGAQIPAELALMLGPLSSTGIELDLTEARTLPHGSTRTIRSSLATSGYFVARADPSK